MLKTAILLGLAATAFADSDWHCAGPDNEPIKVSGNKFTVKYKGGANSYDGWSTDSADITYGPDSGEASPATEKEAIETCIQRGGSGWTRGSFGGAANNGYKPFMDFKKSICWQSCSAYSYCNCSTKLRSMETRIANVQATIDQVEAANNFEYLLRNGVYDAATGACTKADFEPVAYETSSRRRLSTSDDLAALQTRLEEVQAKVRSKHAFLDVVRKAVNNAQANEEEMQLSTKKNTGIPFTGRRLMQLLRRLAQDDTLDMWTSIFSIEAEAQELESENAANAEEEDLLLDDSSVSTVVNGVHNKLAALVVESGCGSAYRCTLEIV